jgi:hypothetical protein
MTFGGDAVMMTEDSTQKYQEDEIKRQTKETFLKKVNENICKPSILMHLIDRKNF